MCINCAFPYSSPESCPVLTLYNAQIFLFSERASQNKKKEKKTKQPLAAENKELTSPMHTYFSLEKTFTKSSMDKNLCWHHDTCKGCIHLLAQSFLCPSVSFCLVNLSVANTMKCCCEQVSLCWKKFVNIIILPAYSKKSLAAAIPFCFHRKLQTLRLRGQWLKNSTDYPIGFKFVTIPPDCIRRNDCAEHLIILPWSCSAIKKKGNFSHNIYKLKLIHKLLPFHTDFIHTPNKLLSVHTFHIWWI